MIKQSQKLVIFALTCLILIGPVMCSLDQYNVVYCIKCVCQVCGNKHYYREKFLNLIGIDLNAFSYNLCICTVECGRCHYSTQRDNTIC